MACTMHEVIENGVYPFRCSRCGRCFLCEHQLRGYRWWICHDGARIPTLPNKGVLVEAQQ